MLQTVVQNIFEHKIEFLEEYLSEKNILTIGAW